MSESGSQLFRALFLALLWTHDPGQFSQALKDLNSIYLHPKNTVKHSHYFEMLSDPQMELLSEQEA